LGCSFALGELRGARRVGLRQPERADRLRRELEAHARQQRPFFRVQLLPVDVDLVHPAVHRHVHVCGHGVLPGIGPTATPLRPLSPTLTSLRVIARWGVRGEAFANRRPDLSGPETVGERHTYRRCPTVTVRGTRFRLPQRKAVGVVVGVALAFDGPTSRDGRSRLRPRYPPSSRFSPSPRSPPLPPSRRERAGRQAGAPSSLDRPVRAFSESPPSRGNPTSSRCLKHQFYNMLRRCPNTRSRKRGLPRRFRSPRVYKPELHA
jgi:hypothetical protein